MACFSETYKRIISYPCIYKRTKYLANLNLACSQNMTLIIIIGDNALSVTLSIDFPDKSPGFVVYCAVKTHCFKPLIYTGTIGLYEQRITTIQVGLIGKWSFNHCKLTFACELVRPWCRLHHFSQNRSTSR